MNLSWHLYKKDDPSTWPQIDCHMVVYREYSEKEKVMKICEYDKVFNQFVADNRRHYLKYDECYYAYVGYVPSGYRTLYLTKCTKEKWCDKGYDDDGYCMAENQVCEFANVVPEYVIEEKSICKEFG